MADTFIVLPNDGANTGKKVRVNSRVVAGATVHEHYNLIQDLTTDLQARVLAADPAGAEGGLVVRNIPSGTQAVSGILGASQSGAWAVTLLAGAATVGKVDQGAPGAGAWLVDGSAVTQPVSDGGGSLTVDGPLTDAQLRAVAVPVSASALPLPTLASTSTLQTAGNASLASLDAKTPALGQALMAASQPVVLASNHSAVGISASALPLPAGASTEATLAALSAKLTAATREAVDPTSGLVVRPILPGHLYSAFGSLRVSELTPVVNLAFNYSINPFFVTTTAVSTGTLAQNQSRAVLQTGVGPGGSVLLESRRAIRYVPGSGVVCRFTATFTAGAANSQQEIGIGDANDGFFVGWVGNVFGFIRRQGGVDFFTAATDFNLDHLDGSGPSGLNLDPTKLNVYEIKFQWLGGGGIMLSVEEPSSAHLFPVHVVQYANSATLPSILNPTLPLHVRAWNSGNTTNLTLATPSMGAFTEGPLDCSGAPVSTGRTAATSVTEAPLFSIRCDPTFQGKTNRVRVRLLQVMAASSTGAQDIRFRLLLNATLSGPTAWVQFDAATSVTSSDQASTGVSGGREVWRAYVTGGTSENLDLAALNLEVNPGDVLTLTAQSLSGTPSAAGGLMLQEMFAG